MKLGSLKNTAVYTVSYMLSRLQTVLLLPVLTRYLAPDAIGVLETLTAFSFFVTVIVLVNLDMSISSYFVEQKTSEDKASLFWTAIFNSVLLSVVVLLLAGFFGGTLNEILGLQNSPLLYQALLLSITGTVAGAWNHLFQVLFRLRFESIKYAFLLVMNTSLSFGLSFYLIARDASLLSVLWGTLIANLVTFAFSLFFSRDLLPIRIDYKKWMKSFLQISIHLLPFSIFSWILTRIDRSLLAHFRSLEKCGIYGVVAKLAAVSGLLLGPFQIAWMPHAMNAWTNGNPRENFPMIFKWFNFGCAVLLVLAGTFGPIAVHLFAGDKYQAAAIYLPILACCNVLNIFSYFPVASFMYTKKTYPISLAYAAGAATCFFLNVYLLPLYGIQAAVYVNLFSYSLMLAIAIAFERVQTKLPYPYARSFTLLAAGLIAGDILGIYEPRLGIGLTALFGSIGVLALAAAGFAMGLFQRSELALVAELLKRKPVRQPAPG